MTKADLIAERYRTIGRIAVFILLRRGAMGNFSIFFLFHFEIFFFQKCLLAFFMDIRHTFTPKKIWVLVKVWNRNQNPILFFHFFNYLINFLQIFSFYQEFIQFYRKIKEFVKDSFKNEKICIKFIQF